VLSSKWRLLSEHRERAPHPVHGLQRNLHRTGADVPAPNSSPRSASTTPIGSTRMLRATVSGEALRTPATYTLFSIARAAFSASYCSVLCSPGTHDEQTMAVVGIGDVLRSGA
jgi:hypothetical protein